MLLLILGLLVFMAPHSVRIFADSWRSRIIQDKGENTWKGLYSVFSLIGLVLIVIGYGQTRMDPVFLWNPPAWTRMLAVLFTLFAFILLAAGNVPNNHLQKKIGKPMYAGIKIWAFAHLLANGRLGDVILFGVFLIWAIVGFSSARKREKREGVVHPDGTVKGTVITILAGILLWSLFAFYLHGLLIGVPLT